METKSNLVGIEVSIRGTSTKGVVLEVVEKKNLCKVEINGKILNVPLSDVMVLNQKNRKKKRIFKSEKTTASSGKSHAEGSLSIDLHGKTRAETNELLLALLDKALLQGAQKLEIIHGHGNGILKKEVTEFLSQSPYIASCQTAENNSGITVAYLK